MNTDHAGYSETMVHSKAVQDITFQTQTILNSTSRGAACVVGRAWCGFKQLMTRVAASEPDLELIFLGCFCPVVWLCCCARWVLGLLLICSCKWQKHRSENEGPRWAEQAPGLLCLENLKTLCCLPCRETLLQLMKEKKYLMEFDTTLVKSWFCVLPLKSLPEFIREFSSDFLVTLQGVFYRLEHVGLSWDDAKVCVLALSRLTAGAGPSGGWWQLRAQRAEH